MLAAGFAELDSGKLAFGYNQRPLGQLGRVSYVSSSSMS
jgi:hypothetical protein